MFSETCSKFDPKFPVLSWQVEKSSPQISPDFPIGDFKFQVRFHQKFHNTLLQAWQPSAIWGESWEFWIQKYARNPNPYIQGKHMKKHLGHTLLTFS